MRTPFTALCLLLLAWAALPAAEDPAAQAYARGEYAESVRLWEERAARDGVTSGLLAALGNAEWRLGHKARAVLCWERALLIDPTDPVALAGIRHAQNAGGAKRPPSNWLEDYASLLPSGAWTLIAAAAFWTAVAALLVPRVTGRRAGPWSNAFLLIGLTAFALALPGIWGGYARSDRAVVRRAETPLRLTPTAEGESVGSFEEGDMVRAGRRLNGHVRVRASDGRTGWVRAGEIEAVETFALPARAGTENP